MKKIKLVKVNRELEDAVLNYIRDTIYKQYTRKMLKKSNYWNTIVFDWSDSYNELYNGRGSRTHSNI